MKILHISDRFPGIHKEWGGAEVITQRIVKLFGRERWKQALVVSCEPSGQIDMEDYNLEKVFLIDVLEDILVKDKWITPIKSELLPYDPLVFRSLANIFRSYNPNLVLLHNIRRSSLGIVDLCRILSIPVCAMVYDYIYFCPTGMFLDYRNRICRSPWSKKCLSCHKAQATKIRIWSEKLLTSRKKFFYPLIEAISSFIVLSDASKELLRDIGISQEKITIIEQPILEDEICITPYSRVDPNHILFIGWVQPRKGLLVVANALKYITKPFTFEAIGEFVDASYTKEVKRALKSAGLDPDVCLKGRVDSTELHNSMQKAGIVVVAEQWENMSPVILHESMLAGKVVVAGSIGGIPEFITHGENGFLTKYNDPLDFAEKLDFVLGNRELQEKIGRNARKVAQKHTDPHKVLSKYGSLFKSCVTSFSNWERELKSWLEGCPCVIICGGMGTRLGNIKNDLPKSLVPIKGKPLIKHILDFWSPYIKEFLLVVSKNTISIATYCESLDYPTTHIVESCEMGGIVSALQDAKQYISGRFVLVLGDCLYKGPVRFKKNMDRGIGVYVNSSSWEIKKNFSVTLDDDKRIKSLVEKPEEIKDKDTLCGMGVYFLDGAVWKAIEETKANNSNKAHITSVMQRLADSVGLFPVFFDGWYININYPEDIYKVNKFMEGQG